MERSEAMLLKRLGACDEATTWAKDVETLRQAWDTCHRADWMIWALRKIGLKDNRKYRLYACACVRESPLADGQTLWALLTDERSQKVVEVAKRYAEGNATDEELKVAAAAAAAAYAAYAAAADAAYAAATAAAKKKARSWQADLLRQWISWDEIDAAIKVYQNEAR